MFKYIVILYAVVAYVAAKPGLLGAPLAYTAPAAAVVAAPAPIVTATSSQVVARNYNGIATAPIVAPVAAPLTAAPLAAPFATASPYVVAPFNPSLARYAATPYASAPLLANYAAAPFAYASPFAAAARLSYAPSFVL